LKIAINVPIHDTKIFISYLIGGEQLNRSRYGIHFDLGFGICFWGLTHLRSAREEWMSRLVSQLFKSMASTSVWFAMFSCIVAKSWSNAGHSSGA